MNPSGRKLLKQLVWLTIYIIFALSYVAGVVIFALQHHNYWACGGFAVVPFLIALRAALMLIPQYRLYQMFPPMSSSRKIYQSIFFGGCLIGIALGLWLMARGIQEHQSWTGSSYFCSMTGMWMAAKWSFYVTLPIYHLREDTLEEEALIKLGLLGAGAENITSEPVMYQGN
ncbi:hypothetical protein JKF63_05706 [Porcisia hertigi]|uniref:Uncharacterized protein n=1 Tax=Porcisia hertigi TaxID=2761500 RepID=A0A836I2U3_9TRYP|nr:hypothetical protein JKF63_05706 [Porcisia hertigi]